MDAVIPGVEPDDEVIVTGTATSPMKRFVDLRAVVATVKQDDDGLFIKVWPLDGPDDKVWFPWASIESIRRP